MVIGVPAREGGEQAAGVAGDAALAPRAQASAVTPTLIDGRVSTGVLTPEETKGAAAAIRRTATPGRRASCGIVVVVHTSGAR